jgi:hypothetical protein
MADVPETPRTRERVLDLLWQKAESGNVAAQKALYDIYRQEERSDAAGAPAEGSWEDIYGENVTPLERRAG